MEISILLLFDIDFSIRWNLIFLVLYLFCLRNRIAHTYRRFSRDLLRFFPIFYSLNYMGFFVLIGTKLFILNLYLNDTIYHSILFVFPGEVKGLGLWFSSHFSLFMGFSCNLAATINDVKENFYCVEALYFLGIFEFKLHLK